MYTEAVEITEYGADILVLEFDSSVAATVQLFEQGLSMSAFVIFLAGELQREHSHVV